jgi:hypothetical protein
MAGDAVDFITGPEWPLLSVILAFVVQYTKSRAVAEELLFDWGRKGGFKGFGYRSDDPRCGGIHWGAPPHPLVSCIIDWENSTVTKRRNPTSDLREIEVLYTMRDFLPPNSETRMTLVRLRRDDVLAMLRAAGLISTEAAPATKG